MLAVLAGGALSLKCLKFPHQFKLTVISVTTNQTSQYLIFSQ